MPAFKRLQWRICGPTNKCQIHLCSPTFPIISIFHWFLTGLYKSYSQDPIPGTSWSLTTNYHICQYQVLVEPERGLNFPRKSWKAIRNITENFVLKFNKKKMLQLWIVSILPNQANDYRSQGRSSHEETKMPETQ